jgi:hypothetical protein
MKRGRTTNEEEAYDFQLAFDLQTKDAGGSEKWFEQFLQTQSQDRPMRLCPVCNNLQPLSGMERHVNICLDRKYLSPASPLHPPMRRVQKMIGPSLPVSPIDVDEPPHQMQQCPICGQMKTNKEIALHVNICADKVENEPKLLHEDPVKNMLLPSASPGIGSEANTSESTIPLQSSDTFFCDLCRDHVPVSEIYALNCLRGFGGHEYCFSCLAGYVKSKLNSKELPNCPARTEKNNNSCEYTISEQDLDVILRHEEEIEDDIKNWISQLQELQVKRCLSKLSYFSCPLCKFGCELTSQDPEQRIPCPHCHISWCSTCKQKYHINSHCHEVLKLKKEQVERRTSEQSEKERRLANIQAEMLNVDFIFKNCTPCPKCGLVALERTDCSHITCAQCKFQWCWNCLGEYHRTPERGLCHVSILCEPEKKEERVAECLKAYAKPPAAIPDVVAPPPTNAEHTSCRCKGKDCNIFPIVGIKYKCVHCNDGSFELCAGCEADDAKRNHSDDHVFKPFTNPE